MKRLLARLLRKVAHRLDPVPVISGFTIRNNTITTTTGAGIPVTYREDNSW